jgi:hypothetical protein
MSSVYSRYALLYAFGVSMRSSVWYPVRSVMGSFLASDVVSDVVYKVS